MIRDKSINNTSPNLIVVCLLSSNHHRALRFTAAWFDARYCPLKKAVGFWRKGKTLYHSNLLKHYIALIVSTFWHTLYVFHAVFRVLVFIVWKCPASTGLGSFVVFMEMSLLCHRMLWQLINSATGTARFDCFIRHNDQF